MCGAIIVHYINKINLHLFQIAVTFSSLAKLPFLMRRHFFLVYTTRSHNTYEWFWKTQFPNVFCQFTKQILVFLLKLSHPYLSALRRAGPFAHLKPGHRRAMQVHIHWWINEIFLVYTHKSSRVLLRLHNELDIRKKQAGLNAPSWACAYPHPSPSAPPSEQEVYI